MSDAAIRAADAVVAMLDAEGVTATRDPGAFYPHPVGVLVGRPSLTARAVASLTYSIPVYVVSGDPLASVEAVDRLLALADDVAIATATNAYRPDSYSTSANAEPLPAFSLDVIVTVTYSTPIGG